MEKYGPTIIYHHGKKNVITNTFSLLPCCDMLPFLVVKKAPAVLFDVISQGLTISNNPDLLKCFHNLLFNNTADSNPVGLKWMQTQQNMGIELCFKGW